MTNTVTMMIRAEASVDENWSIHAIFWLYILAKRMMIVLFLESACLGWCVYYLARETLKVVPTLLIVAYIVGCSN